MLDTEVTIKEEGFGETHVTSEGREKFTWQHVEGLLIAKIIGRTLEILKQEGKLRQIKSDRQRAELVQKLYLEILNGEIVDPETGKCELHRKN